VFTVVHLIPTGVGAAIGGFAGDAGPVTRLLAGVADRLMTHPNAVNGAHLLALPENALYVEGAALDAYMAGRLALRAANRQRIGILVDRALLSMPAGTQEALQHAMDAVRAVHGVPLLGWQLTPRPLGARTHLTPAGLSSGEVADPAALLEGARALQAAGATAIAILADLGPLEPTLEHAYDQGQGVDPIGGLEAVLSHLIVQELGLPAAHAPLWPYAPEIPQKVDPRAAAEHLGHTFLPCILLGLARHPQLVPLHATRPGDQTADTIDALVVPQGCLGGPGALAALSRGIPIIVVQENQTRVQVHAADLKLDPGAQVFEVANYLEAAGLLTAWKLGLDPSSLRRPLSGVTMLSSPKGC
jgi:hypothetical protein